MRSVMFNFRAEVAPEQQTAILDQIEAWHGVSKTGCLKPDAKSLEIRRMCYAYLEDSANVEAVVKRLSALSEVESAFIPAERRLSW